MKDSIVVATRRAAVSHRPRYEDMRLHLGDSLQFQQSLETLASMLTDDGD